MDRGVRWHAMIYEPGVRFVQQGTEIPLAGIAAPVTCLWIAAEIDARLTDHVRTNCESSDGRDRHHGDSQGIQDVALNDKLS
jgi:hypothetical protein